MVKPYTHGQFGGLRFDWDQGGVGSAPNGRRVGKSVEIRNYQTGTRLQIVPVGALHETLCFEKKGRENKKRTKERMSTTMIASPLDKRTNYTTPPWALLRACTSFSPRVFSFALF